MKKILINLVMISLVAGITACSDDNNDEERCIVGQTQEGCMDGFYVRCEADGTDDYSGHLVRHETINVKGTKYKCDSNNKTVPVSNYNNTSNGCSNGIFSETGSALMYTDKDIFQCVGNEVKNVTGYYA